MYIDNERELDEVYDKLEKLIKSEAKGIILHKKKELARSFHYTNTPRVGSLIFEPLVGWAVSLSCSGSELAQKYGPNGTDTFHKSTHGHTPNTWMMRGNLMMSGPSFKTNLQISEIPENVDLYSLMCYLLDILPAPNNGTMDSVKEALIHPGPNSASTIGCYTGIILTITIVPAVLIGISICMGKPDWKFKKVLVPSKVVETDCSGIVEEGVKRHIRSGLIRRAAATTDSWDEDGPLITSSDS